MTDGPGRLVLHRGRIAILAGVLGAIAVGLLINAVASGDAEQEYTALLEDEATGVVLAYGRAPEGEACDYLSSEALERLGGEEGCAQQFQGVPGVEFEIESLAVDGETASVRVLNPETENPVDLTLTAEEGAWKISSFPGLETIVPPEQEEPITTPPAPTEPEGPTSPETETESGTAPPGQE